MGEGELENKGEPFNEDEAIFMPIRPIDQFEKAVEGINDRKGILKKADEVTKPLKSMRRAYINGRKRLEEEKSMEEADRFDQHIRDLEDQINEVEDAAKKKMIENISKENI